MRTGECWKHHRIVRVGCWHIRHSALLDHPSPIWDSCLVAPKPPDLYCIRYASDGSENE